MLQDTFVPVFNSRVAIAVTTGNNGRRSRQRPPNCEAAPMFVAQYRAPFALTYSAALGFNFDTAARGQVWVNLCRPVRKVVAERLAIHALMDGHETVRVHPVARRVPALVEYAKHVGADQSAT